MIIKIFPSLERLPLKNLMQSISSYSLPREREKEERILQLFSDGVFKPMLNYWLGVLRIKS